MFARIVLRILALGSVVPLYGCMDESVLFTEEKIGEYDYQISSDPSSEEMIDAFAIDDGAEPDAILSDKYTYASVTDFDDPSLDARAPTSDDDAVLTAERGGKKPGKRSDEADEGKGFADEGKGSAGGATDGEGGSPDEGATGGATDGEGSEGGVPAPAPVLVDNNTFPSEGASDKEIGQACGKSFKGKAKRVYMMKQEGGKVVVNADTVLAIKVTGNQSKVNLSFAAGQKIAGICIFAAGNQSQVTINSELDMGKLVYVARGNMASASFTFAGGTSVDHTHFDLSGNNATVAVSGLGDGPCRSAKMKGNAPSMTCE